MSASGLRVRQAREVLGLSQTDLAKDVGVSQPSLANYERDLTPVPQQVLEQLIDRTGFPAPFFNKDAPPPVAAETLLFREHSRLRARDRNRARITAELAYELLVSIGVGRRLPALQLPDQSFATPDEAAGAVRACLGIDSDRPVDHACRALERGGVRVLQIPQTVDDGARLQAFSGWGGLELQEPIITLYRTSAGDRLRWSLAHELGHIVLHRRMPKEEDAEFQANKFASSFLLPRRAFLESLQGNITLTSLADLKRYWRVSMQAMIMRAASLGAIDERRKRSLFVQLSRRGWRTREPIAVPPEKPRLLRQLVEIQYGDPPNVRRLSADVGLPVGWLTAILLEQDAGASPARTGEATVIELPTRRNTNEHS
jgi:Zn-dependent peptidase ImmA (M78 family)/DNA-binding XRE family transcriptional regulator